MPDVSMRTPPVTDGQREARCVTFTDIEVRDAEGGGLTVSGYAAVFDSPSEDLGGFIEEIKPGAFRKVLRSKPDVRFLINHDGIPLARTTNGTLRLKEDTRGLKVEADLSDTQTSRDFATSLKRGDVDQMSFMFRVEPDGREWFFPDDPDELARRVLYEMSELYDVSGVTFPAYPATEIGVRGMIAGEAIATPEGQLDETRFADVCERVHAGDLEASAAERRELDRAADRLDTVTPWQMERALRSSAAPVEPAVEEPVAEERAEPEAEVAAETPADEREADDFGLEVRRRRLALTEDFQPN
jgi:HK97 family phage prohead protease